MNLDKNVQFIRNAINEDKLVIFVGAGVSKNSNLPDWAELIRVFIQKLNYPKAEEKPLSADEYLKIPQYYYNEYGPKEYNNVIKDTLDIDAQPNDIHELIFKLNPTHIITTNYDRLLESTPTEKKVIFDVISKDKDLLHSKKRNHIIKMHGDIKNLDTIVLKEKDYLNYSQSHILIETFIKSLLTNHSFLFIGYSLNDYNLKQIISWVDYLAKDYTDLTDRPKHFIIQEPHEDYKKFIENDYKSNNIFIIDPNDIDNEYMSNIQTSLTAEPGQKLYGTLMYIKDYPHQLIDKLYYGALQLKNLRSITTSDLFKIYRFKYSEILNGDTLILLNPDQKEKCLIKDIISPTNFKETLVKETFIKLGLNRILIRNPHQMKYKSYDLSNNNVELEDEFSTLFKLELQCDYTNIEKSIDSLKDENLKALYLFKLQHFEDSLKILDNQKQSILNMDIYNLLRYRFNLGLLNQLLYQNGKLHYNEYRYIRSHIVRPNTLSLNYLNQLFENNTDQKVDLDKLRQKHLKVYLKEDNSVTFGDIQDSLKKMKSLIYEYYFYIKKNGIFLDYFSNMENFFIPYVEVILSTYSPKTARVRDTGFSDENEYSKYVLNKYDWDILIKHTKYKQMRELLQKYNVDNLQYDASFNVIKTLSNLCQYIKETPTRYNINYLKNFVLLLTVIPAEKNDVNEIVKILEDVLLTKEKQLSVTIFDTINVDLNTFLRKNKHLIDENSFNIIIEQLFKKLTTTTFTKEPYDFLNTAFAFSPTLYEKNIDEIIKNNNINYILGLTKLLTPSQKKLIHKKLSNNINTIKARDLIEFIFNNLIEYTEEIENRILNELENIIDTRSSGYTVFPDPVQTILEGITLMFLIGKNININKFQKYIEYYNVLEFIVDPEHFDYETIELDHYNWINTLQDENLLKEAIKYGKTIIQKKLKYNIDNGFANKKQMRLYYKYFE